MAVKCRNKYSLRGKVQKKLSHGKKKPKPMALALTKADADVIVKTLRAPATDSPAYTDALKRFRSIPQI